MNTLIKKKSAWGGTSKNSVIAPLRGFPALNQIRIKIK
jgi:hypothetical protein